MKTILLTGACGGIGQALARALDAEGYHLLLLDLDPLSLEALDGELRGDHTLVPFDLWRSGYDAYTRLAKMIAEDHGKLDAQIHLAAVCGGLRPLIHHVPENWQPAPRAKRLLAQLWRRPGGAGKTHRHPARGKTRLSGDWLCHRGPRLGGYPLEPRRLPRWTGALARC